MKKTYFIDLDGTMYMGTKVIDGAIEFIDYLLANDIPFLFLTNNASRTRVQAQQHMLKMGFKGILPEHFYTSAMAASDYIRLCYPDAKRVNFIGQDGLDEALRDNGFELDFKQPEFFFVGLDRTATYQDYSFGVQMLVNGARLVGTNNDRLLVTESGFGVGNGSVVALFEHASNQESIKVGKPHRPIIDGALKFAKVSANEVILVGDNLETDILTGIKASIETIFVTTGVHTMEDCHTLNIQPTYIVANLYDYMRSF
ncbi:MAG: HAD-IIA family hydrolase [Erysipelotrichaceae bacterium]